MPIIVLGGRLLAFGGRSMLFWGVFLPRRSNFTRLARQLGHTPLGPRRFETKTTRATLVGALLTWGEGWHNNHHAHPTDANTASPDEWT